MNQERLITLLRSPVISEKATRVADLNKQFVFEVARDATKPEIRQAVELMFDVKVEAVRVCNVRGKIKRFRQSSGRRSGSRKAYVTLKPGFDIDYLGGK